MWWQDADRWRVDRLLVSGETDLVHDGATTVEWSYERDRATISRDPDIRLPRASDLLPPVLAERLLRGVSDTDTTPLAARRLAGRSAAGLRVRPSSEISSIDHVDLWTDVASGVPLLVEVYAAGSSDAGLHHPLHRLLPRAARSRDARLRGAGERRGEVRRRAGHRRRGQPVRPRPPTRVRRRAGADRRLRRCGRRLRRGHDPADRDPLARPRGRRLPRPAGSHARRPAGPAPDPGHPGPLGVLLTGAAGDGGWLLAGTLTADGLERAADDVLSGFVFLDGDQ